ncbi:MAG: hypothetical protein JST00_36875 [Deltaproteobacteria bacterium]|nr:hypothetical protein [Deltaproteobacteria bacterium]
MMPADEAGPWDLTKASLLVDNLNTTTRELALSFALQRAGVLDVASDTLAAIPETQSEAKRAFDAYAATGRVTNAALTIVVVRPSRTGWVSGWGNQDQPLGLAGHWPIITVNTRIAKSRDAHWIAHELGHVFGFYDTTYYESTIRENAPYTRCGLNVATRTFPRASAPLGAKQNFMSYDTEQRRSFLTDGYAANRQVVECWLRSAGP